MGSVATEAGHWYRKDGTPCHEVPYKTKSKNGQMRPTTLADARELGLVPSVTAIIKCASAPALEAWKRNNPDWETISRETAELGSAIHGCIEKHLLGEDYDPTHKLCVDGALACLDGWCGLADLRPERSFAHPLGYGGKCDIHKQDKWENTGGGGKYFPGFVADFKSKDFNIGNLPLAWDNHSMQLAAYREGFGMPQARCAIIYVSTQVAGLTHLVEVDEDELKRGWGMFKGLLAYWKAKNGVE